MPKRRNQAKVANKRKKKPSYFNQPVRLHYAHQAGVSKIQDVANELKVRFQIIKTRKNAVEPQVLYFMPAEADPSFNGGEVGEYKGGFLFHQWAYRCVRWKCAIGNCDEVVSVAAVRKWIKDPHLVNEECIVCMNDVKAGDFQICLECHCILCSFCMVRHILSDEAMREMNSKQCKTKICVCHLKCVLTKCPQCRTLYEMDLRNDFYYKVMDRLNEFNPAQRQILEQLRYFDRRNKQYPAVKNWFLQKFALKPGAMVVLHGLNQQEWNGKVCEITGRHVGTNGIRRWPVRLKDGSENTVHVKEENMQTFETPALRMNKFEDYVCMNGK